jgi:hypothetical protein
MILTTGNNSSARVSLPNGGWGCLLGLILTSVLLYFVIKGLYHLLYWAAPALFVLALILNWRAVAHTGTWIWRSLQTSPLATVLLIALCVVGFPFFTLYLFLKALSYNKIQALRKQFEEGGTPSEQASWGFGNTAKPDPDEYTDYEEIDSKPK